MSSANAQPLPTTAPISPPNPAPNVTTQASSPAQIGVEPVPLGDDTQPAPPKSGKISAVIGIIAMIVSFISGIWLLVLAFQKSVVWGLLCLFVPFPCMLIFAATNWEKAKVPFLISIVSSGLFIYLSIDAFHAYQGYQQKSPSVQVR